jgi:predicted nucleotidyltransferase
MRTLDDIRQQLQAELPDLRERYNVDRLGICGSYVRGEQTDDSDLDLLVTFTETPDLFEMVNLKRHLEDRLDLSVDLGMPSALKDGPAAENIRREVEYL